MRRPIARLGQLGHVFAKTDGDEPMDAVVRRFWSRTRPASDTQIEPRHVVDLAAWAAARGHTHGTRTRS